MDNDFITPRARQAQPAGSNPEPTPPTVTSQTPIIEVSKPRSKCKWVVFLLVILLLASSAGIYYWMSQQANKQLQSRDNQINQLSQQKTELQRQLEDEKAKSAQALTENSACKAPDEKAVNSIKGLLSSRNLKPLEKLMADELTVVSTGSNDSNNRKPAETITDLNEFIKNSGNWDFKLSPDTLTLYKKGKFSKYFTESSVVGKSKSGKVIALSFDCNAKINQILLANKEAKLN